MKIIPKKPLPLEACYVKFCMIFKVVFNVLLLDFLNLSLPEST